MLSKVQNHTQQGEETITTVKQGMHMSAETHRSRVSRENPRGRGGFLFTLVLEEQRLHQVDAEELMLLARKSGSSGSTSVLPLMK